MNKEELENKIDEIVKHQEEINVSIDALEKEYDALDEEYAKYYKELSKEDIKGIHEFFVNAKGKYVTYTLRGYKIYAYVVDVDDIDDKYNDFNIETNFYLYKDPDDNSYNISKPAKDCIKSLTSDYAICDVNEINGIIESLKIK